jgi:hypothetical protein
MFKFDIKGPGVPVLHDLVVKFTRIYSKIDGFAGGFIGPGLLVL